MITISVYANRHMAKKILIVEDDTFLAQAYAMAFDGTDISAKIAKDGQDALDQLKAEVPDAVVLDLLLPKIDGFGVLAAMKADEHFKNIPVIIASNLGQQSDIDKGKLLGANDYIVKSSTSMSEVTEKVKKLLGL